MIQRLAVCIFAVAFAGVASAAPSDPICVPATSTFELLQRAIFDRHECNNGVCHGSEQQAGLDLRPGASYRSLTDRNEFVVPGKPDDSLLWMALAKKTLGLPWLDATPMPKDGLPLTQEELDAIRLWILAGAPATGIVAGVDRLVTPCPPPIAYGEEAIAHLPECRRGDPLLMLPGLFVDPPSAVRVFFTGGKRRVEFTSRVGNLGDGPLVIQARTPPAGPGHTVDAMQVINRRDGTRCMRRAGTMRLSDSGDRWQYTLLYDYELRVGSPTGPVLAYAGKPGHCIIDSDPIYPDQAWPHQFKMHCTDPIGRMGLSVGYKDTYARQHPQQWLDLDTDPDVLIDKGTYYLLNIVDPAHRLWEKDDKRDDNVNFTAFKVGLNDPDPPRR